MSNTLLNDLLREYELKREKANFKAESAKKNLYLKIPRLQEIEDEINSSAINTAKNILINISNNNSSVMALQEKVNKLKLERQEILKSFNISDDYFKPKYECEICKDTGYIFSTTSKSVMCNCLKQKLLNCSYNKSNINNISIQNFSTFDSSMFSDDVNIAKYKFNISPRKNIENIKRGCIEFIKNFDNPNYKNLLFTGNTGLGKTFMSNCIAAELLKEGKTVLYQTAPVLLETIIDNKMSKIKTPESLNFYNNILETDLLIIDDLGTECINSMKLSELFTILNTRLLNLNSKITKTIISTNLNIKDIFKNYEERIGSRIAGFYNIYFFFGDDLRLKK